MGDIVWLASYPKSGNTWFRIFLTNLCGDNKGRPDINDLGRTPIASARGIFDDATGLESADLTFYEIDTLRPEVYKYISATSNELQIMKVHDAYTMVGDGKPLFPLAASKCVIYLIRDPLDVAVSFAHHLGVSYDKSIEIMANNSYCFCGRHDKLNTQLRQKLLTWSNHVVSWVEQPHIPVCVIRYEDLQSEPLDTFKKAVDFTGLTYDDGDIQKAIDQSSFSELQCQESENGFKEKSPSAERFFRRGKIGDWQSELYTHQVSRIIEDHGAVMRRFGYIYEDRHQFYSKEQL